ncbi:hypothetical protein MLD38_014840 [Melastoma candidum]|uniref:Uncharacterized protein n=1 Tax=Melastoma candidum TaxID=119954 RepID=A0ACB9RIA7_9MYRT|nr:hypothetical protein MLD38_014840 [Melastoma candidum]
MPAPTTATVVLDNGGAVIKVGRAGDLDPTAVLPNYLIRPLSSKKFVVPSPSTDLTSAAFRRPIDRGYLINPDLQRDIWSHAFAYLSFTPSAASSLLLTVPLFTLPSIYNSTLELVFEDFGFGSACFKDPPSLAWLHERSKGRNNGIAAGVVVESGFSWTQAAPVVDGVTLNYGVRRVDLGGKALTNYLKEMVSYRKINVMDETLLMDEVKEKLCFVSLNVQRDLQLARKPGRSNPFRCTYVLPDGVTHTKGFVKDPVDAERYVKITDNSTFTSTDPKCEVDDSDPPEDRKRIDLTKNEFDLTNERFLVPEMIFRPADLGMNQAGLAECIVRSIDACHPHLHPLLYGNIVLTGGSTLFPRFKERLEMELRPLVPDHYRVKIVAQQDPILSVWRGGSQLASRHDFEAMCVTKSEYEELGSTRCRRRFFN